MHVSQEIILMYTLTTDISEILYILVEFRKIKMNQHSTVKPPKKHRELTDISNQSKIQIFIFHVRQHFRRFLCKICSHRTVELRDSILYMGSLLVALHLFSDSLWRESARKGHQVGFEILPFPRSMLTISYQDCFTPRGFKVTNAIIFKV